jgi:7,8-dihydroneopterin aldolase/epimerase/oxygenase
MRRTIQGIVEGRPHHLIESVAEQIASSVLRNHRMVHATRIQVQKPHVSLPGTFDSVSVEILRYQTPASAEAQFTE